MTEQEVRDALKASFDVPGGREICAEAMANALDGKKDDKEWIKENFSRLVEDVQVAAYELYLASERPAAVSAFREVLGRLLPERASADDLFKVLGDNFWALDKFFLGLTQGRRPRAGKAFEHIIHVLFTALGYPYTSQAVINGQPDFLLPSVEHYRVNPMDCIIFTVKRTLRERWRQITTEGTQGYMFFLATIDKEVAARDLPEMLRSRIYLVLPESIRAECYPETPNAISFEMFFEQHLDPAMARWRSNGIVS